MYYTLACKDGWGWCPQFGDWDRSVVEAEWQEFRELGYHPSFLAILATAPDQSSIDAAVAAL